MPITKKSNGFQANKKVLLFLNGEIPHQIPDLSLYDAIFCTDGAYAYLQDLGIQPNVVSGDFDSIDLSTIDESIEIIPTPDQNYTDFEKCLQLIVEKGYTSVDVYGASGKQQDHFIGNLHAAYQFKNQLELVFIDNYSTYQFIPKEFQIDGVKDQIISLIPFPSAENISTKGLLYPLAHEKLDILSRIGTRNKAIENTIHISYETGELVLFIIK